MKYLGRFYNFISDLVNQKKNYLYVNKNSTYQIIRFLYRVSNGLFTNIISYFISGIKYKSSNKFDHGYRNLHNIELEHIYNIKNEINKMRVFDQRKINYHNQNNLNINLEDFASSFEDLSKEDVVRLDILKSDLLSNNIIAKFALEEKWVKIIKDILNIEPKLIDVTSWYTLPHKNTIDLETYNAQIWHRDVDKLRDIKILIYLSDVTDLDNGPFEILVDTHKTKFNRIVYDNNNNFRVSDEKIKKQNYVKYSFLGRKGSNFVVDTRCLHRGGIVQKERRHIIELYFSNSILGRHDYYNDFSKPKLNPSWESYITWKEAIERNPEIYKSLFIGKD